MRKNIDPSKGWIICSRQSYSQLRAMGHNNIKILAFFFVNLLSIDPFDLTRRL